MNAIEEAPRWRLIRQRRDKGTYFVLQTGRGHDRRSMTLGYVSPDEAERALEAIQEEEDNRTVGRVWRLYYRDRAAGIMFLMGDRAVVRLLGAPEPDWGGMRLRDYYEQVFSSWREAETAGWPQEKRHWTIILAKMGHERVRKIDEHVVADYLDGLTVTSGKRKGQPFAGNTKRLHRAAIKALLTRANRLRHIKEIPDLAKFRQKGSTTSLRKAQPLTIDELIRFIRVSKPKQRAMWATAAGEGLRPSELVRMDWADVHWDDDLLLVRGTKTTDSKATIPLTPLAKRELMQWHKKQLRPQAGVVFPARGGRPYSSPDGYRRVSTR
jgi:integrase